MENQASFQKYNNPLAYLKLFFRRKWLILTPLYIGIVLGVVASFVMPASYDARTMILVEEQRTINPLIQDLAVATSVSQRVQSIREVLLGWNSLTELVKKLKLDKEVENQLQYEELIKELQKRILVRMSNQNIFSIEYSSKDAQEAYAVVKTLSETFIEENIRTQTKETDVAIDFLKEQLQVYKRKIKESEISDLEKQLNQLSLDATEQHPMVKELRQKLNDAQKELASGEYKLDPQGAPVSRSARETLLKELDNIKSQDASGAREPSLFGSNDSVDDANAALFKLLLMDRLDSSVARDIRINEQIYNMLLQRLETAKITQRLEASRQGTRYTVIEPPRLPLNPPFTKKMIIFVIGGVFMGGALGVGLVFAREFMDQSFLDIDDAKLHLKFPVLGAISRITTREEIDNEKHKERLFIISGLAGGIFVMVISMLYYLLKK